MKRLAIFLAALAVVAVPASASAGEFTVDCEDGPSCTAGVHGEAETVELANTAGERITCTTVSGTSTQTSGTSTGSIRLTFKGCKEQVTIFKFSCNSAGQGSGIIDTGTLVTHIVNLSSFLDAPGILITNFNLTFECTGFGKKTLTGSLLGRIDITESECGKFTPFRLITFLKLFNGQQADKQVTQAGTIFDLISNNDSGGEYKTSSLTFTANTTSTLFDAEKLTC
jgi:hypothetical protein